MVRIFADVMYFPTGTSPHPIPCATSSLGYSIKLSCDRHLLAAAHNNIRVGPVLAVLKVRLIRLSGLFITSTRTAGDIF
jgi:hypothetical protein